VRDLAFSADGKLLGSGSDDWTVRVWRPATGEELATLRGHTGRVSGGAFLPGQPTPISASFDGTLQGWEATSPQGWSGVRLWLSDPPRFVDLLSRVSVRAMRSDYARFARGVGGRTGFAPSTHASL